MKKRHLAVIAAFLLWGSGSASAASSEWTTVDGGAVRVVVSATPNEDGQLRGALQIELDPGWKTYWLDPGDAGVPPSVAVNMLGKPGNVAIGFPPPERHNDGYATWAGYDRPVALALTITPPPVTGAMEFSVFLGVCETICIPVQSTFSIELDRDVANSEHEAIVERAFAALPRPAHPGFRVTAVHADGDDLIVEAEAPDLAQPADLFLASTENRVFGTPKPSVANGRLAFRVPLLSVTQDAAEEARYTLVSGNEAVTGVVGVGK